MLPLDRHLLRILIVALLVLLPLRMAWSAAAGYCEHETDVTVAHVGHHAHGHSENQPAGEEFKAKANAGLTDADCSACHAFFGHLPESLPGAAAPPRDGFITPSPDLALPSVLFPDIERPKWHGVV